MSDGGIAVVVVAYNSEETLDECLARLRAAQGVEEIRVVDNASRDAGIDIVQRHALADARLRFIANPDNPGFAVACNQGAAASTAPWLAFVNPDCFIEVDTLARLREAAASQGDALVGGVMRGEDGALDAAARRRDPDFAAMLRSRRARELSIPRDPATPLQLVDAVSGALMVLPRSLFARIGGFDEGYRLHAEDLDLCRRVRQAGAMVAVANEAEVLHVRGVSSRARPLFVEWHKHRGLWRYFGRFEAARRGRITRMAVFAMIWGRFPLAALRAALRR
ncbi:glycosyltransferase family 2 protein [Thermomonas sp. LB-4]|uniref:glycosyltransferase family 2 protein n=1 Tax=Thermomonas sp. LB-4 TaxID=3102790 RepID=UPI002ED9A0D2